MLTKTCLLIASAVVAAATPVAVRANGPACNLGHPAPTLPLTGGPTELPAPDASLKLKYIGLGLGIQNYTCAAIGEAPVATGALAMLYDITSLYPNQSRQSLTLEAFEDLPHKALSTHAIPLNFNSSTAGRVDPTSPGASLTNPFTRDAPLKLQGMANIPFLGHHFFDSNGVPTFNLAGGKVLLRAAKVTSADAPADAYAGPMGTGAVAWLDLNQNAALQSVGAKFVYRVLTAGGNSHGCSKAAGADTATYAATYWFFD